MKFKLTKRQEMLFEFIKEKHKEQKRKYTNEDYAIHPLAVAEIVSDYDCYLGVEVALCHDLFEDTDCGLQELFEKLYEIDYTLREATVIVFRTRDLSDFFTHENFPQLSRKTRKKLEAQRLSDTSYDVQTVKIADMIHNLDGLFELDPVYCKKYVNEKAELLTYLTKGNRRIKIRLEALIMDIFKKIKSSTTS